ncbi:MAG: glycosyl transferase family 2 [Actinomycetota bacterium]
MDDHRRPADFAEVTPSLEELTRNLSEQIDEVQGAELIVGIPCYDSQATVANVVRAVETGLRRHYADVASAIVILDSGSSDATVATGMGASTSVDQDLLLIPSGAPLPKRVATTLEGIRGKGNALRPLFTIGRAVGARALACVDSDLRSITPVWVEQLLGPVLEHDADHVLPMYLRHKHDATITNSVAYPMTAALYGTEVRQPIGGDFGFSGRMATMWAEQDDLWTTEVARFGIDIWMTTSAIAGGYRLAQTLLGSKLHAPKDPGEHLGPMFHQVVGTMFALAGRFHGVWSAVERIAPAPVYGFPFATGTDPLAVNVAGLIGKFRDGVVAFAPDLEDALEAATLARVREVANGSPDPERFAFPLELWIDVVQDLLVVANLPGADPDRLIDAMIPLYFARTASFVREAGGDDQAAAEHRIGTYPAAFLARKDRLRSRWADVIGS